MATTLTFAIPVTWNSGTAYTVNTIVFVGKRAFTALKDVPKGVDIGNTEYWKETGVKDIDLSSITNALTDLQSDVNDNAGDIAQAQRDIVSNANSLTQLSSQLSNAVDSITKDAQRLDNIMVTLYSPTSAS